MTTIPWHRQHSHYRQLRDRLAEEGFTVLDAWTGRHLRLRVAKNGREITLTLASTPAVPEYAVSNTMKQARRSIDACSQTPASAAPP